MMGLLIFSLVLIASFLGLLSGILLSNIAIEEIKTLAKYLKYTNIALIATTILIATYNINKIASITAAISISALLIIFYDALQNKAYDFMGVPLCLSMIGKTMLSTAVLLFIIGLIIGTMHMNGHLRQNKYDTKIAAKNKKIFLDVLKEHALYLPIGIISYLVMIYALA